MYHLLKQIAITGIKTEAPPRAGRGAARRGASGCARTCWATSPARSRSATSTPARATAASSRSTRSTIPYYNLEGLGIKFVASPRHADMLLVTGPVSRHMEIALKRTYDATPEPKLVVAIGDCGCTGGIFGESYASCGRVSNVIPVDVAVPGCPPTPLAIMQGILTRNLAAGRKR